MCIYEPVILDVGGAVSVIESSEEGSRDELVELSVSR